MAKGPESRFEKLFIADLREMFPGCVILKNDSGYLQGIPDRLLLWGPHWACLEFKPRERFTPEPNQPYYVHLLNEMSFAAFVYPENREEVLRGIQQAFVP